jgi:Flp pilus assembly protein TadG
VNRRNRRTIDLRSQKGQSLTEFALALPILALLLFAVIQFGITFNNYVTLTDATRAGARKAAVGRQLTDPVGGTKAAVVSSICPPTASSCNLKGFSASGSTSCGPDVTVSSTWQPAADATVTARWPYKISLLGMVVKSGCLSSTTTERVE